MEYEDASGLRFSGSDGYWADYEIYVPVADVEVDVYAGYALSTDGMTVRFSNADIPIVYPDPADYAGCVGSDVYGEFLIPATGGWNNYYSQAGTSIGRSPGGQ